MQPDGLGLLILVIAMINYFNFAMAISPLRIRSINMQKILGSKLSVLRGGSHGQVGCLAGGASRQGASAVGV